MSDAVLDRGLYYRSPMTQWYRERAFKVAFFASLLIHAALIAFVPGFRAVVIELPTVLNVELVVPEQPQESQVPLREAMPPAPVKTPALAQRSVEETLVRPEPQIEPRPQPDMQQPEPDQPPIPRAEIATPLPRPEPRPEPVAVPEPEPSDEPRIEPKIEVKPEPVIEPRPEPRAEVQPTPQPIPQIEPSAVAVAQPRTEPLPAPVAPPAPTQSDALTKQPSAPGVEPRLLQTYGQSISKEIKRYQKYPPLAQRRGWEGTAEVHLQIAADGKVSSIVLGKSSGRSILDEEALNMVRRASPLPQAPQNLRGRELTVTVPIVFKLRES